MDILMLLFMLVLHVNKLVYGYNSVVINVSITCSCTNMNILMLWLMLVLHDSKWEYEYINVVMKISIEC